MGHSCHPLSIPAASVWGLTLVCLVEAQRWQNLSPSPTGAPTSRAPTGPLDLACEAQVFHPYLDGLPSPLPPGSSTPLPDIPVADLVTAAPPRSHLVRFLRGT